MIARCRNQPSFALVLFLSCVGCGWRLSVDLGLAASARHVEIYQRSVNPVLGIRIDLVGPHERVRLLDAGETYIGFAHAYRSSIGIIGVLLCGTRSVRLAYDERSGQIVPYELVRESLDRDAQLVYGRDPRGDALGKCLGTFYQDRFRRRFPQLRQ